MLDPNQHGFAKTGLRVQSTIRLHRLMTLSTTMIVRELGVLPTATHQRVTAALNRLFAIS